ncbi:MAG: hypothetical protein F6K62_07035 [Sphaerospermopsis sp. SIO1G2]|nr:hypothetical protein [Sphaerospermopsis sp. SIO1G2]
MDLSFKDMKFMIEAVDNLIQNYQQRINKIEDLEEYEYEVSDLGNDIMFLSSLRKKIDDGLNASLKPNTAAIKEFLKRSITSRERKKRDTIISTTPTPPKPIKPPSTNPQNAHKKSDFDEDK